MIQVGEVLDKYELLERVGQGGMAIVYRGLDRSLKRVVAVKILHGHLADYQEARDRFEREAQAVAKLRHENILEIFDFAVRTREDGRGETSDTCYIVTEFIDGRTLKQVITDRPIAFPEIGAMIILQVARALGHAHAQKILHRDIKPENIMIRSDGVVKLMDFGISHMVDLERLTVTGQLLGSPAYMAPEHVEGRPLDFRTDVFAVGIVLYQLTTGRLPFEGKNPHEVLKRIAECRFIDPRQVNPRIGNRLGRIILRAMSARPDDRYPAIGEMVTALEGFLEESGLPTDKIAAELARYFASATSYEQALEVRLVDHLVRRGQELLDDDAQRSAALDVFDRVLTIDPKNAKVLAILDGIAKRQRIRKIAIGAALAVAVAGGAFAIHVKAGDDDEGGGTHVVEADGSGSTDGSDSGASGPGSGSGTGSNSVLASGSGSGSNSGSDTGSASGPGSGTMSATGSGTGAAGMVIDAGVPAPTKHDAGAMIAVNPPPAHDARPALALDAAPAMTPTAIRVAPRGPSAYRIRDGEWIPFDTTTILQLDSAVDVTVKHVDNCCQPQLIHVIPGIDATFELPFLPGTVTPMCTVPGVLVSIDGKVADLNAPNAYRFGAVTYDHKAVTVEFVGGPTTPPTFQRKTVSVTVFAGKAAGEVKCE